MNLPPDPDEPTHRLRPEPPPGRRPIVEREVPVAPADELVWREELLDRLRSLRAGLVLVGVIAAAALGVGLWALVTAQEQGDGPRGASSARVSELEDRVDTLESRTENAASRNDLSDIREDVRQLDEQLSAVEQRADRPSEPAAGTQQALEELQQDLGQLDQRVQQLEQREQPGSP